ncbi:MAG: 2-oxoglutarate dehydrogenase E1 subunit family protein, partial [Stellaceae bacterium]
MSDLDQSTFLYGQNAAFIAELHSRYLADPASVDASWRQFFATLEDAPDAVRGELEGPGWGVARPALIGNGAAAANGHVLAALPQTLHQAALDSIRAVALIRGYRVRGHLVAKLDPLGLTRRDSHPDLDPATYGFTAADFDRPIFINDLLG